MLGKCSSHSCSSSVGLMVVAQEEAYRIMRKSTFVLTLSFKDSGLRDGATGA